MNRALDLEFENHKLEPGPFPSQILQVKNRDKGTYLFWEPENEMQ